MDARKVVVNLMDPYKKQEAIFMARLEERGSQCYYPYYFDFLEVHYQFLAETYLKNKSVSYRFWGGYEDAERQMLCIYPDDYQEEALAWPIRLCMIPIDFPCSHRNVLGALMALGIERECIGDILIQNDLVQFLFTERLEDFIGFSLKELKGRRIEKKFGETGQLRPVLLETKEMRIVAASLRVDGVIGKIWGMSRADAQRAIRQQRLKVNGKPVLKDSHLIAPGDILSLRGKGKASIAALGGKTRKGNIQLLVEKYI